RSFQSRKPSTRIRPTATPRPPAIAIRSMSMKPSRRWRACRASSCMAFAPWRLRRRSRSTISAPATRLASSACACASPVPCFPARLSPPKSGPTASATAGKFSLTRLSIPTTRPSSRAASPKSHPDFPPVKITIGLSLSLTGEYSPMGRQAEIAIRLFIADANASSALRVAGERCEFALECHDDASDPVRCAEIYRAVCADRRADIIFGPYSNRLTGVAADIVEQPGRVFVNPGGPGDDLSPRRYKMIVGVLSPASDYLRGFVRLLAQLKLWRKRVAIVAS